MTFTPGHSTAASIDELFQRTQSGESPQAKEARPQLFSLPDQVVPRKWRPWTLHPAVLLPTTLFALGIISILEYLQRTSDANHGVAFITSGDSLSGISALCISTLLHWSLSYIRRGGAGLIWMSNDWNHGIN